MQSNHQTLVVSCLLTVGLLVSASVGAFDTPDQVAIAASDPEPFTECSSHRVIGVLASRSGDCELPGAPQTPNWTRHRMFGDSTPELAAWTEAVPGELQRYCSYEYVGTGPVDQRAYDELLTAIAAYPEMPLELVGADCHREVVQGNGRGDVSIAARLADEYHDAIQWIPGSALESTSSNRQLTTLAIVDTVSQEIHDDPRVEPRNDHGVVMRAIAADIACPRGELDCLSTIRQYLATPRSAEGVDWERGGEYGTVGDLASSIVAAVGHWRMDQLRDPDASKRLVISASLGWEPNAIDSGSAPRQALEQALQFAACNGAIVVAAAGNVADPGCSADATGPLAPASYQLVEAPDATECARLGYSAIDGDLPIFGDTRPLVYAAGGIDGRNRPIVNARPEAMPPLVAHAQLVSVETNDGHTKPLTGTSASTAAVAGIASLVWSYVPELSPGEVMQLIYESGSATGLNADFGFVYAGSSVREASVCAALSRACAIQGSDRCPTLACAEAPSSQVPVLPNPYTGVNTETCPARPWTERVLPQPAIPPCPMCVLDEDDLQLILDDDYDNLTLENVMIELYDSQGGAEYIDYGDLPLTSSSVYTVTDSDLLTIDRSGLAPDTAWVEMEFTDYSNPTAPVTVYAGNELTIE